MDFYTLILNNKLFDKGRIKVSLKTKLIECSVRSKRKRLVKRLWNDLWPLYLPGNWSIFNVSMAFLYEAFSCYKNGDFEGCALLCRSSLESIVYQTTKYKVDQELAKKGHSFKEIDSPGSIFVFNGKLPRDKLTRDEIFTAAENKDINLLKKTETINRDYIQNLYDELDVVPHYSEGDNRSMGNLRRAISEKRSILDKDIKPAIRHLIPLFNETKIKDILLRTCKIEKHLLENTYLA